MLPTRHLPALAAAERALGRLDAALADPAGRARHTPGALRRSVLASLRLDGAAVTEEDLALMRAAPDTVAPGARAAAERAAALLRLARVLDTGRFAAHAAPPGGGVSRRSAASGFAAAGLQAALEGLALLESDPDDIAPEDTRTAEPAAARPLRPWSTPWAIAAFQGWLAAEGLPDALHADAADVVAGGIAAVERTLVGAPGLVGASRALLHLHHRDDPPVHRRATPDPFESPMVRQLRGQAQAAAPTARFWSTLARLAGPSLLRAACGLEHAHLPIAIALATSPAVFRTMLVAAEDEAVGWLLDRVAERAEGEVEVLSVLAHRDAACREALTARRRDAGARALLDHLWTDPALTVRGVAALLGTTERAARTAVAVLVDVGILRGVPAWADGDGRPRQAAARPLAYVVTESAALAGWRGTSRRRRRFEPPAGSPMLWQPIATAPLDGKSCLVWAGRPVMAAYSRSARDDAPAWHAGRRVLQPTHWLPLAPPEPLEIGGA